MIFNFFSDRKSIFRVLILVSATLASDHSHGQASQGENEGDSVLVFIDHSNKINDDQIEWLMTSDFFVKIDALPPHSKIVLTEINDGQDSSRTARKIHIKRPKYEREDEECRRIIESCVPKGTEQKFKKVLEDSLTSLLKKPEEMDRSPIFRGLASPKNNTCDSSSCHLWVISDMLEYSDLANFYESIPNFQDLKNRIGDHWGFPEKTTNIIIWRLKRCPSEGGEKQDSEEFKTFWNHYSDHVTGNEAEWKFIPIYEECTDQK